MNRTATANAIPVSQLVMRMGYTHPMYYRMPVAPEWTRGCIGRSSSFPQRMLEGHGMTFDAFATIISRFNTISTNVWTKEKRSNQWKKAGIIFANLVVELALWCGGILLCAYAHRHRWYWAPYGVVMIALGIWCFVRSLRWKTVCSYSNPIPSPLSPMR